MEETQEKLRIFELKREKKEFNDAKKQMLAKLKADKRARGVEVSDDEDESGGGGGGKGKSKKGMNTVNEGIGIVETLYTEAR
jgi:hypothetical protein